MHGVLTRAFPELSLAQTYTTMRHALRDNGGLIPINDWRAWMRGHPAAESAWYESMRWTLKRMRDDERLRSLWASRGRAPFNLHVARSEQLHGTFALPSVCTKSPFGAGSSAPTVIGVTWLPSCLLNQGSEHDFVATAHEDGAVRLWDPASHSLLCTCTPPQDESADGHETSFLRAVNPRVSVTCTGSRLVLLPNMFMWHLVWPLPAVLPANSEDSSLLVLRTRPAPQAASSRAALLGKTDAPDSCEAMIDRTHVSASTTVGLHVFVASHNGRVEVIDPDLCEVTTVISSTDASDTDIFNPLVVTAMCEFEGGVLMGTHGGRLRRLVPIRNKVSGNPLAGRWREHKSKRGLAIDHPIQHIVSFNGIAATVGPLGALTMWDTKLLRPTRSILNTLPIDTPHTIGGNVSHRTPQRLFVGGDGVVFVFDHHETLLGTLDCGGKAKILAIWHDDTNLYCCSADNVFSFQNL